MGTAHVEAHARLVEKLTAPKLAGAVRILQQGAFDEDGIAILLIESQLLAPGFQGVVEIVIEGESLRFKRWADT